VGAAEKAEAAKVGKRIRREEMKIGSVRCGRNRNRAVETVCEGPVTEARVAEV
jgi:hypothetical protein